MAALTKQAFSMPARILLWWGAGSTHERMDDMPFRSIALLTTVLAIAGCATAEPIPLPNGRQGFSIDNCDSMAECYKKAAEACGGGKYVMVGQGGETIAVASGAAGVFTASAIPQYNMTIECE